MSFFDHLFRFGYSKGLHNQLKGLGTDCETYNGGAVYQVTSIVLIIVSLIVVLNYYYGLFNNPRFTHRRIWLLNILTAAGIVGFFAYFQAVAYLPEERHCSYIHFSSLDCVMFAFNGMFYTAIACLIFSLLFKWKSIANKKIPF